MTSFRLLPPIARPPHDPLWLTLNARLGWRAATLDNVEVTRDTSLLQLKPVSGTRSLTEESGSFGGLVPPANIGITGDDGVFLLDVEHATLRKYDSCGCRFISIPGIGGIGHGPRQFFDARAIASVGGDLFIADSGNARVSVFSQREYVLRGTLEIPDSADLATAWNPVSIASDRWGRVFVADPNNGCIHRFSRRGIWQARFDQLGAVRYIAVDNDGRLYVVVDGASEVTVLNGNGVFLERVDNVARIAERFRALPFSVAANGIIAFTDGCGAFDLAGNVVAAPVPVTIKYPDTGSYVSQALDSRIHRCQWHRVQLSGWIPAGTSIVVRTYSSEVELPDDVIADLTDDVWDGHPIARAVDGDWDCLIRSGGGRYLWLRLDLFGTGPMTPRLDEVQVEFPRISLRRFLPAVFGEDPTAADFTDRFLSIFDTTFRDVETQIDNQARLFDARSTPAGGTRGESDFLSWIASWIGLTVDQRWPEKRRREFVRIAPKLFDARGTRDGLWQMLLLYLGIDRSFTGNQKDREPPPFILEHFKLRRWLIVGSGRLGGQAVLWGRKVMSRAEPTEIELVEAEPEALGYADLSSVNDSSNQSQSAASLSPSSEAAPVAVAQTEDDAQNLEVVVVSASKRPARNAYDDPFHVYASRFTVFVPACIGKSAQRRKSLEMLLRSESPAHTRYNIEYVEPTFRIGIQSMIGFDAVVGRYPTAGVTVGASTLGSASVLSEGRDGANSQGRQVPSMRIGNQTRIGATTRLD